jgi:hemolysin activation/secretion protein
VFSTEALRARIARHEGASLTLLEIYAVADELTELYRAAGYTLATVTLPAQRVASGVVRLEVIEGRLARRSFRGNVLYPDAFLSEHLDQVPPGEVVRGAALEREMLLLNALPGLSARAVLKPGAEYGTSELVVETEERRLEGSARLDNYGRNSLGNARLSVDGALNNPLGLGVRFRFGIVHTEAASLRSVSLGYSLPLGTNGTRVRLRYSRFVYDVIADELATGAAQAVFVGSTLEGDGTDYSIELRHPLVRTRRETLRLSAGAYRKESDQFGTGVLAGVNAPDGGVAGDQLNAVFGGAEYTRQHADRSVTSAIATASTNTKENPDGTRDNAHRGKLVVDVSHLRRLPWWGLSLYARLNAGWSIDPLMDIEQYRLGGPGNVRAYPSSELAGDEGYLVQLQLNPASRSWGCAPTGGRSSTRGGSSTSAREWKRTAGA